MKVIELFSGIGAQTQALKNIGIEHEIVGVSDIDKFAHQSYEAIHGQTKNFGDIMEIDELPEADMWTYSFPCTDISLAGKQEGIKIGTRSGLLYEVERLLKISHRPKYLVLENVPNLVGEKHLPDFDRWLGRLDEFGYNTYWKILNAKDYGVPQNRKRIFAVSILKEHDDGTFEFPQPFEYSTSVHDLLEPPSEVEDYYYKVCPSMIKAIDEKKVKIIDNQNYSQTITTKQARWNNAGMLNDENGLRYLTTKECWRLMGFDDDAFSKAESVVSRLQLYKQAGNSIVVDVLEQIFAALLKK